MSFILYYFYFTLFCRKSQLYFGGRWAIPTACRGRSTIGVVVAFCLVHSVLTCLCDCISIQEYQYCNFFQMLAPTFSDLWYSVADVAWNSSWWSVLNFLSCYWQSILLTISIESYKILSNIILERLTTYTDEIIGDYQCGFRLNRSTINNIFCI